MSNGPDDTGRDPDHDPGPDRSVVEGDVSRLLRDVFAGADSKASGWDGVLYRGSVVGRFELVREVGHGGFGEVWEARDRELKRRVAFKAIHRIAGAKPDDRTVAEAEAAAHLSHPNVVTLYDVGRSAQGAYLVMEFLEGKSLSKVLRAGPLPPEDAVRIAAQVARGLSHAHGRGVLHRDLTPSNVFLCDDGTVKILDLGLAQVLATGTPSPLQAGSAGYVPPERLRGEQEDARGDLYALGAILHRMLAGKVPETGGGGPGTTILPGPEPLRALVARLTAEDPARRPPSATEVERELEAMTDGGSEAAARLAVAWRRRRRVGGILGLAAATVVIAAAGMNARAQRERTGQLPGGGALILRIPEPVLAAGESSRAIATRFSPDGSTTGMVPTTWWSSDTRVAVVDSKGMVTARGPGTATITAFLGKTSATDSVTVPSPGWELVSSSSLAPPPPGSLVVMPGEERAPTSSFAFGRSAWVQVSIDWLSVPLDLPDDADTFAVQVDVRMPYEEGQEQDATVAVVSRERGLSGTTAAKFQPADRWRVIRVEGSLARCTGKVMVDGVDVATDERICRLRGRHVALRANRTGAESVDAAWSNLRIFRGVPVENIQLVLVRVPSERGAYARGSATLFDARGNLLADRTVRWESSDPEVATVDGDGVVHAHRRGDVTITARCEGKVATARLMVDPSPGKAP
jgi:hypothetical protein